MIIYVTVLLIPTLLFLVIAASVVADRLIFLKQNRLELAYYRKYLPYQYKEMIADIKEKKQRTLYEYFVYNLSLKDIDNKEQLGELVKSGFSNLKLEYYNRTNYLAAFAKLSLISGLFGTVVALSVSLSGLVGGESLLSNIAISLICLAGGLFAALPLIFLDSLLKNRMDREFNKMEIVTADISASILSKNKGIDSFKIGDKKGSGRRGRFNNNNRFNKNRSSNNNNSNSSNSSNNKSNSQGINSNYRRNKREDDRKMESPNNVNNVNNVNNATSANNANNVNRPKVETAVKSDSNKSAT